VENDLPLILDDTKRARRPEDIAQTIYDVTSGRSRGVAVHSVKLALHDFNEYGIKGEWTMLNN
jgi:uncharacterized protein (DUF927 family)